MKIMKISKEDRKACMKKSICPKCGSKTAIMLNCGKGSCDCGYEWKWELPKITT